MRLVLAPMAVGLDGINRPIWPSSWRGSQATSATRPNALWIVEESDAVVEAWATLNPTSTLYNVDAEAETLLAAKRADAPVWVESTRPDGSTWGRWQPKPLRRRNAAHAEYRQLVREHVNLALSPGNGNGNGNGNGGGGGPRVPRWLVPTIRRFGMALALSLLVQRLGPEAAFGIMAVLGTDNFTGTANTALDGRSLTTGGSTWSAQSSSGNLEIDSTGAACGRSSNGGTSRYGEVAVTAYGDQYSEYTVTTATSNTGVGSRMNGATSTLTVDGYLYSPGDGNLYRVDNGSLTTIATGGSASVADGSVVRMESIDDDHEGYDDGVSDVGPAADTTYATGRPGLALRSTMRADDYEYGDFTSGSAAFPFHLYYGGLI